MSEAEPEFPEGVEPLTWNDTRTMGVHRRTGELYWRGHPVVTQRRLATTERWLPGIGVAAAVVGAIAACVQAWAAVAALSVGA